MAGARFPGGLPWPSRGALGEVFVADELFIEDLEPGLSRSMRRVVTLSDIEAFGELSGDRNPIHFDEEYAAGTRFGGRIAHGLLSGAFISAVLGMQLPGRGAVYLEQTLRFLAPVRPGDELIVTCTVKEVLRERKRAIIDCLCQVGDQDVVRGEAKLLVPSRNG